MKRLLAAWLFVTTLGTAAAQQETELGVARLEGLKQELYQARQAFRLARTVEKKIAALEAMAGLTTDEDEEQQLGVHSALAAGLRSDDDAVVAKSVLLLRDIKDRAGARKEVLFRLKCLQDDLAELPPPPQKSPVDEERKRLAKALRDRVDPPRVGERDRPKNRLEQQVAELERKKLLRHVKAADALSRFAAHLGQFRDDQVANALGPVLTLIMERDSEFAHRPARALCQQGRRRDVRRVIDLIIDFRRILEQEAALHMSASLAQSWNRDGSRASPGELGERRRRVQEQKDAGKFLPKWTLAIHEVLMDLARERQIEPPDMTYTSALAGIVWQRWFDANRRLFPITHGS